MMLTWIMDRKVGCDEGFLAEAAEAFLVAVVGAIVAVFVV